MQEQVKATFLVNAAVLLEFRGTKLLIDGIYDENGHCFSNLSERQWEKLKAGEGEFAGIEYLLFTHEHGDHFCLLYTSNRIFPAYLILFRGRIPRFEFVF